ncbi:MAG: alpha/beta hydrolase [Chloroflexi bacterium]|nr:alpha/beta hydrolase [Chloroflexota bacterium]MBT4515165.1 alpha/beta hydrolase [Chloroflexota bacterium]MBT6682206.1 alpha/beta hydrolase [Chloroflexota bacterium]
MASVFQQHQEAIDVDYVDIDGVKLAYRETGSGYPLVLAHEFAGSMESWDQQVNYFARKYRVIVYNARGYTPSDVPEDPDVYHHQQQVEDLKGLLDHLGIEEAHIGGLSMGAYTTIGFGLTYPEMSKSLIVAGAGSGSEDVEKFHQNSADYADQMDSGGMEAMAKYVGGDTRARFRHKDPAGYALFEELFMSHSNKGAANTFRGFQGTRPSIYTREAELKNLRVPMFVINGDEDEPCLEPGLFLKRTVPTAGMAVVPQTGHAVNIEEPMAFNQHVAEFLSLVELGTWLPRDYGSGDAW